MHSSKTREPIVCRESGRVTEARCEHLAKVLSCRTVMPELMSIEKRLVQP